MKYLALLCTTAITALSITSVQAAPETIKSSQQGSFYSFTDGFSSGIYAVNEYSEAPNHIFDGYIVFDLSTLTSYSSSSDVTGAKLRLFTNAAVAASFMTGNGVPVTGATFTISDAASLFDTDGDFASRPMSGSNFSTTAEFEFVSNGSGGYTNYWIEVDVTEIVKYWLDNPSENFGFRLSIDTTDFGASAFATSAANKPQLEVIPEPTTWAFLAVGAGLFVATARSRRKAVA